MKKVYLVKSGLDYKQRVEAAFSTKEMAQKYIDSHSLSFANIDVLDLDPNIQKYNESKFPFFVKINRDEIYSVSKPFGSEFSKHLIRPTIKIYPYLIAIFLFAEDEENAILLAKDLRKKINWVETT